MITINYTTMNYVHVVVLAGGLGKRMESSLPKVLHVVQGKPMCVHVLEKVKKLHPKGIYVVVGKYRSMIEETIQQYMSLEDIVFVNQDTPKGTGHALMCAKDEIMKRQSQTQQQRLPEKVLVLCGDVPFLTLNTMRRITQIQISKVALLTTMFENPHGYGRIIKNKNNFFQQIVEEKECTEEQKQIKLVNGGVYCFQLDVLCAYLPLIQNVNAQNEYYLTDIFEIIKKNTMISIDMIHVAEKENHELLGINTKEQLNQLQLHT